MDRDRQMNRANKNIILPPGALGVEEDQDYLEDLPDVS